MNETLPSTLDGRLAFAYRVARREGRPSGGEHWLLGRTVDRRGIQVTLRFGAKITAAEGEALLRSGCVPARLESGELASVGPVVTARCTWEGLWVASSLPDVRFISPTFGQRILPPAAPPPDTTAHETEATALSAAFYPAGGGGKGVTVCDMDSGIDPFHPFFFRADGGAYPWIDVNGNGGFDPLVDAVDFNGNGVADPGERLGILKSRMLWYDWYSGAPKYFNTEPAFLAGHDWLFQDENADGQRNFGPNAPYGDAKPTFGEQLYLADDVNRNGKLDPEERLMRLLTPKIKAVRTPATHGGVAKIYARGVNLAQVPEPNPGDREHGSMVLGTIGGGVAQLTRYAGIAPEADLLLAATSSSDLVTDLAWAKSQGANIVLWEMATWYNEFLDGSSGHEQACDAASDEGVLQIGAAGNLGGSQKHRVATHPPGSQSVSLVIPAGKAEYLLGDFLWRGQAGGNFSFTLNLDGQAVPLTGQSGQVLVGNTTVQWQRSTSTRQTTMLLFYLVASGGTIPGGTATFDVVNSGTAAPLHGYVTDSFTAWEKGVHWPVTAGATDQGTYGTPGVGDQTLAVGTYFASLVPDGSPPGELAYYSGQGPRINGGDTVDFAAPEDHVTAFVGQGAQAGDLWVGGGTSNASPVAVGVAAILKGLNPAVTSADLSAAMRTGAWIEAGMGAMPNDRWGRGKVRGYRAKFGGTAPPANQPPSAGGRVDRLDAQTLRLDATGSADPEGSPLSYRWDVDYDGTFDVESSDPVKQIAPPLGAPRWAKLEVVDAHGSIAQVLLPISATGTDGGPAPDAGPTSDGGSGIAAGDSDGGSPGSLRVLTRAPTELGARPGCGCTQSGALAEAGLALLGALMAFSRRPVRRRFERSTRAVDPAPLRSAPG